MPASQRDHVLVTTQWVHEHLNDPNVRIVEIDVDTKAYDAGHVRGAIGWNWQTQLQDRVRRDIVSPADFERLLMASGIAPGHTIVLYGDHNNWFAAYGFWLLKLYGHADVRLMDGGRAKWLNEEDKELTVDAPAVTATDYRITTQHPELRARVADVLGIAETRSHSLVDVRSTAEFTGEIIAPPGMTETAQRAGHIPGARSVPWSTAVAADGTFKSDADLRQAYFAGAGVDSARPVIAYCRIGERSSHTWFVLKYLLGVDNVRNYDGSWTEYGNLVAAPIELGAPT